MTLNTISSEAVALREILIEIEPMDSVTVSGICKLTVPTEINHTSDNQTY